MRALIDGDIVLWEIASTCQGLDPETGDLHILNFDQAKERCDHLIETICRRAGADEEPFLFLTGKGNFREAIAKKKGYKANRKDVVRPFHYENIKAYLKECYITTVCEGYEADDGMAIAQTAALRADIPTIICTRDKDLRQVKGWHYGWECGQQAEWGPHFVEGFGELIPTYYPEGHKQAGKLKKLVGTGDKWFLAQLLMGDSVDNIPGLKGWGPVKVLELLEPTKSYEEGLCLVIREYQTYYGNRLDSDEAWPRELTEQAQLVYMVREKNDDGSLKHWRL